MNVEDFMENEKPRKKRSVFDSYRDDINILLKSDYTQNQIIEFLKKKSKCKSGLSQQNLSLWLKRNKDQEIKKINKPRIATQKKEEPKTYQDMSKREQIQETDKDMQEVVLSLYPKPDYL